MMDPLVSSALTSSEAVISDGSDNADLLDFCFLCSRQFFHERVEDYGTERLKDEEVLETFFEELGPVDRSLLQCCPACKALCKTLLRTKAALSSLIDEITNLLLRSRKVSYLLSKSRVVSRLFQSSNSSLPPCETSTSYLQQPLSQINFHKDVSSTTNNSNCFPTQFDLKFDSSNMTVEDSLDLGLRLSQSAPDVVNKSVAKTDKSRHKSKQVPLSTGSDFSLILNESIMNSVSDNACDVGETVKVLESNTDKQITQFSPSQQPFAPPMSKNKSAQNETKLRSFISKCKTKSPTRLQLTTFKEISNHDICQGLKTLRKLTNSPCCVVQQPKKESKMEVDISNSNTQFKNSDANSIVRKTTVDTQSSPTNAGESLKFGEDGSPIKRKVEETSEKPLKLHNCGVCGKSFQTRRNLKNHVGAHNQERKYICEICGVSYRQKIGLETHVAIHNGESKFQCQICKKVFTQKSGLQRHSRIHTGKYLFQCDLCGKQFIHHTSFSSHKLVHEGVKSFACTHCDLTFKTKWHRERHIKVHTGEKSHKCETCGKSFTAKYNLVEHLKTHENTASRHKCPKCPKTFTRKFKMKTHFDHIHAN